MVRAFRWWALALWLLLGCERFEMDVPEATELLCAHPWQTRGMVDHADTVRYEATATVYRFHADGRLEVLPEGLPAEWASWSWAGEAEYLRMAANTYRLAFLNETVLRLELSSLDLVMVPAD